MPGGDRTGPMGAGPRTGWGMGNCAGAPGTGNANPPQGAGRMMRGGRGMGRGMGRGGFGRGMGRGFGMGWQKWPAQPMAPEPENKTGE